MSITLPNYGARSTNQKAPIVVATAIVQNSDDSDDSDDSDRFDAELESIDSDADDTSKMQQSAPMKPMPIATSPPPHIKELDWNVPVNHITVAPSSFADKIAIICALFCCATHGGN